MGQYVPGVSQRSSDISILLVRYTLQKSTQPNWVDFLFFMVGMVGFEPTDGGFRVPCLTTWRHSKIYITLRQATSLNDTLEYNSGIVSKGLYFANLFFSERSVPYFWKKYAFIMSLYWVIVLSEVSAKYFLSFSCHSVSIEESIFFHSFILISIFDIAVSICILWFGWLLIREYSWIWVSIFLISRFSMIFLRNI